MFPRRGIIFGEWGTLESIKGRHVAGVCTQCKRPENSASLRTVTLCLCRKCKPLMISRATEAPLLYQWSCAGACVRACRKSPPCMDTSLSCNSLFTGSSSVHSMLLYSSGRNHAVGNLGELTVYQHLLKTGTSCKVGHSLLGMLT